MSKTLKTLKTLSAFKRWPAAIRKANGYDNESLDGIVYHRNGGTRGPRAWMVFQLARYFVEHNIGNNI